MPAVARIKHFGAPTSGWNARNNVTEMAATDAVRLDNIFPDTTLCRVRHGCARHAQLTNTAAPVRSLMVYSSASGDQLIAAQGDGLYLVSVSDVLESRWDHFDWDAASWDSTVTTPPTLATGFTSDIWQYVNFSTAGGQRLVAVNGTNKQWIYDGLTWVAGVNTFDPAPDAVLPPDTHTFSCIASHQNRLYFTCDDNLYLYWLPVGVYQGEIHGADLGSLLPAGGAIAALSTWTRDNGFGGMDDLLIVVTTRGEVLSFSGIDPDTADGWNFVGRFVIGRPVSGHRQLVRTGPDLMLICDDGFQPLASYLATGQSKATTTAISYKIGNAVTAAVQQTKGVFGWEAVLWPNRNALLVNVPQADGTHFQQFVVNTITGAWCRFIGMDAQCWATVGNNIYFGGNGGKILQADSGFDDDGVPIFYDLVTAFQTPDDQATQKRATMCRPFLVTDGDGSTNVDVNTDYWIRSVSAALQLGDADTEWNEFNWDQANWAGGEMRPVADWYSVSGIGNAFSVHMSGSSATQDSSGRAMFVRNLQILAFDIALEVGMGPV
jgi:hypothetical protein